MFIKLQWTDIRSHRHSEYVLKPHVNKDTKIMIVNVIINFQEIMRTYTQHLTFISEQVLKSPKI